jgi:hypothetical protein
VSDKNARLLRRNFLLTMGAGGAAAAAAVVAGKKATPRAASGARARGYQETAHIRNYYRTAKV